MMARLTTQQNNPQNTPLLPRAERASFEKITSFPNLYKAYKEAARAKHGRASVLRHDLHAESILLKLQWELQNGRYRHGKYNCFTITDPKPREVSAAPFTDRIVHHAIVRQIEPLFDNGFIYDSYACRRGKGTHAAARRLQHFLRSALANGEPLYVLRADITKFFASIDHAVLKQLLLRRIHDERTLALLGTIVDSYRTSAELEALSLSLSIPRSANRQSDQSIAG
jgi:retron-type reverse transcriptase